MQLIDTVDGWRKSLDARRSSGAAVGLVPTMGALHAGHGSLIARATQECDVAAVTIFVNPLQFGDAADLDAYPRTLEADVALAEAAGAALVFAPSAAEMYPRPMQTVVSAGALADRWEGEGRPGHFDGVATVVTKLFAQAGPCRAYFGEKDYQQLCVVRRLVSDLDLPVDVRSCETVREPDGLAMSSRNTRLGPADRALAPLLHRALERGADELRRGGPMADRAAAERAAAARDAMHACVQAEPAFDLCYAEAVDAETLEPLSAGGAARLIIAARLGGVRLIDNMGVNP